MKKARSRKVCRCLLMGFVICALSFSCLPSFALDGDDPIYSWNTNRPDSRSRIWLRRSSSSAFSFESQSTALSITKPSIARFLVQGDCWSGNAFTSGLAQTLTYLSIHPSSAWSVGFVYKIELDFQYQQLDSAYVDIADFSKMLLVFPVGFTNDIPSSTFTAAEYSTYFYDGFKPASITKVSSTNVRLTYNVPIYPETTFAKSTVSDGCIYIDGFALYDSGTGVVRSTYDSTEQAYKFHLYYWFNDLKVSVYSADEYTNLSIQQGFDDIENAIDDQTQQLLYPPVPTPDLDPLIEAHEAEHDLQNAIMSTVSFQDTTTVFDSSKLTAITAGAQWLGTWMTYVIQNNAAVSLWVSVCMAFSLMVLMYRSLF